MNERLREQLRSSDPAQRRQAIMALARTTDDLRGALQALAAVYRDDPLPELRELAAKAGRHLKAQMDAAAPQHPSGEHRAAPKNFAAQLEQKRRSQTAKAIEDAPPPPSNLRFVSERHKTDTGSRLAAEVPPSVTRVISPDAPPGTQEMPAMPRPKTSAYVPPIDKPVAVKEPTNWVRLGLVSFALVLLVGTLVLFGPRALESLQSRLGGAGASSAAVTAQAKQYFSRLYGSPYYLLMPENAPARGLPAVIAFHGSNGSGLDMIAALGATTLAGNAILIAPSFASDASGGMIYNGEIINDILDDVYYRHHEYATASVGGGPLITGFSGGAMLAALFAADYPHDASGVLLMGLPRSVGQYPDRYDLPYWITVGEFDERKDRANVYFSELLARGIPVTFEIIVGSGHQISQQELDVLTEFMRERFGR